MTNRRQEGSLPEIDNRGDHQSPNRRTADDANDDHDQRPDVARRFLCNICNKMCLSAGGLRRHRIVHRRSAVRRSR